MRNRMTLASASIVVAIVAASCVSVQPGSAQTSAQPKTQGNAQGSAQSSPQAKADACLARPGATAPKGSHWFYRLERSSGRRCWYLGAANQRVARERAARTERAVPIPAPAPTARREEPARVEAPAATAETNAGTVTNTNSIAATPFSAAWPRAPHADAGAARAVPTIGSGNNVAADTATAQARPADAPSQEMPPAQGVTTAADRASAQPSAPAPGIMHLAIFLAATAAFVAIAFRSVLKLAAVWRGRRDRRPVPRPAGPIIRTRAPDLRAAAPSIEEMSEPAIARLREIAERWNPPSRVPRPPALEAEPDHAVEGATLRQRRVA